MKKCALFILFAILSSVLYADGLKLHQFPADNGLIKTEWSPFQLSLAPEKYCQLISGKTDIYGLALGIFLLEQESAVLSVSLTGCQNRNYGLQCAVVTLTNLNYGMNVGPLINFIERNYGLQISFLNIEAEGRKRSKDYVSGAPGVQLGAINIGQGFQIGVLNYNTNAYIPLLPLFNFSM